MHIVNDVGSRCWIDDRSDRSIAESVRAAVVCLSPQMHAGLLLLLLLLLPPPAVAVVGVVKEGQARGEGAVDELQRLLVYLFL